MACVVIPKYYWNSSLSVAGLYTAKCYDWRIILLSSLHLPEVKIKEHPTFIKGEKVLCIDYYINKSS